MARIAALAAALTLALAPAAGAQTPSRFLESGTITPYTTKDRPFVTTTSLVAGRDYRLILTGVWTVQWPAGDSTPAYEEEDDSLYCVRQKPIPKPENGDCNGVFLGNWSGVAAQIGNDSPTGVLAALGAAHPAQAANYAYDLAFRAKYSGILKFWDPYAGRYGEDGGPTSATGSFGFQLYGTGTAPSSGGGGGAGGSSGYSVPIGTGGQLTIPSSQNLRGGHLKARVGCAQGCTWNLEVYARLGGRKRYVGAASTYSLRAGAERVLDVKPGRALGRKIAAAARRGSGVALVFHNHLDLPGGGTVIKDVTIKLRAA